MLNYNELGYKKYECKIIDMRCFGWFLCCL